MTVLIGNQVGATGGGFIGGDGEVTAQPFTALASGDVAEATFKLSAIIYVDGQSSGVGARRRVEVGIGNDNLYQCSNRECCPIKTWNSDIKVNLNVLPFTESELTQARIFVVDADDVPTLVGRIQ